MLPDDGLQEAFLSLKVFAVSHKCCFSLKLQPAEQ